MALLNTLRVNWRRLSCTFLFLFESVWVMFIALHMFVLVSVSILVSRRYVWEASFWERAAIFGLSHAVLVFWLLCNFSYFPLWFWERDFGYDCISFWSLPLLLSALRCLRKTTQTADGVWCPKSCDISYCLSWMIFHCIQSNSLLHFIVLLLLFCSWRKHAHFGITLRLQTQHLYLGVSPISNKHAFQVIICLLTMQCFFSNSCFYIICDIISQFCFI